MMVQLSRVSAQPWPEYVNQASPRTHHAFLHVYDCCVLQLRQMPHERNYLLFHRNIYNFTEKKLCKMHGRRVLKHAAAVKQTQHQHL